MAKKSAMCKPMDDKLWRAQDDARTLAMAEEIRADSARMKAAAAQAKKMQAEKEREAKAMAKIAKTLG